MGCSVIEHLCISRTDVPLQLVLGFSHRDPTIETVSGGWQGFLGWDTGKKELGGNREK